MVTKIEIGELPGVATLDQVGQRLLNQAATTHSRPLAQWRAGLHKPTKTSTLSSLQPDDAG